MTLSFPCSMALATNSSATSFDTKIPTATEPTGDGVFDLLSRSIGVGLTGEQPNIPDWIEVIPYGGDANNEAFDMRIWGWSRCSEASIWIPRTLMKLSATLGNVDGSAIATGAYMADTISVGMGPADNANWRSLINCEDDTPASVQFHTRGCQYIEFCFDCINAAASAGSELLTNGAFTTDLASWTAGAGWAWDAASSGVARHTAGNVATLAQAVSTTDDEHYQVIVICSNRTAGSFTISAASGATSYAGLTNGTHTKYIQATATGSNVFSITPTTDFDGDIESVSIKNMAGAAAWANCFWRGITQNCHE